MTMGQEILKVNGLETGYGQKQVIYGLDLAVQEGEVVAIIGHNGAGKSTILKAIFGLLPAWKGEIVFKDQRVEEWPPAKKIRGGLT